MKLYPGFDLIEAVKALEYAIRLMRKDIAIDPEVTEEKLEQLNTLSKIREAFKKKRKS